MQGGATGGEGDAQDSGASDDEDGDAGENTKTANGHALPAGPTPAELGRIRVSLVVSCVCVCVCVCVRIIICHLCLCVAQR